MQQHQRRAAGAVHQRMQAHGRGQRVGGGLQVVAQHAVQRGQCRNGPAGVGLAQQGPEAIQRQVQPAADEPGHAAHAAVDQAGEAGGALARRRQRQPRDLGMQGLDEVGHAGDGIDGEAAAAAQVLGTGHGPV
ncbi:MAG: hypothetical protein ACK44A_08080 [Roseateles sp.]